MTSTISQRLQTWVASRLSRRAGAGEVRTYAEWRDRIVAEHGVVVMDDEGGRRCAREGRAGALLSRREAEGYFLFNSLVKRSRRPA